MEKATLAPSHATKQSVILSNQFASGAVSRFFFHEGNLLFVDNVKFSVVIKTNAELDGRITCTAAKDCELLEHRASGFQPPEKTRRLIIALGSVGTHCCFRSTKPPDCCAMLVRFDR